MDRNEFRLGLIGDPIRTKDKSTRIRYIVSEELRNRAKERRKECRPDIASSLLYAAGQIDIGRPILETLMRKISKDIAVVEARLVDGISIADYPESSGT